MKARSAGLLLALALAAGPLLAACGSSDGDGSAAAPAEGSSVPPSLETEEFCAALARLEAASQTLSLVDSTDLAAVEAAWQDAAAAEEQVAALAPAEVTEAVDTLVGASQEIRAVLEANGWDTQLLASDEVRAVLDDPDVDAAQRRVNEFSSGACGP